MVVFMNEDFLHSSEVEHHEVEVFGSIPNGETNLEKIRKNLNYIWIFKIYFYIIYVKRNKFGLHLSSLTDWYNKIKTDNGRGVVKNPFWFEWQHIQ